jgi:hypothetical protein
MKPKPRKPTPEELARSEAVRKKLLERIAYHEAKLADERRGRSASA